MTSSLEDIVFEALEEPIMIVGNRIPDGDSVGSMAAMLEFLRGFGLEAYLYFVNPPASHLSWMVEEEDLSSYILEDYASLVVLDDKVDSDRLGFEIKPDISIVNIDHHASNFTEDFDYTSLVSYANNDIYYFQRHCCATASVLVELGIFHPYLICSLYTDSVGFTVNCDEAISVAAKVIEECQIPAKAIEKFFRDLIPKPSFLDASAIPETSICLINGADYKGLIVISPDIEPSSYKVLLEMYRKFSDFLVYINRETGQTSFRSNFDSFPVLPYATHFGGGGHQRACGCTLPADKILLAADQLLALICRDLESPSIQWVN